jgi:hypothetical protein
LAYAICAVLFLLELGLLKLIQTTNRFQKLTAWMSAYQSKYRQSAISSGIELSDMRDPKNDLGAQLKNQACNQTQTLNQKFARADFLINLMQPPDAASLATAGVSRADDSDLEMVQRSARLAVSQRLISSPSVLNPIVSSPLARAAVTRSISVRRQHD